MAALFAPVLMAGCAKRRRTKPLTPVRVQAVSRASAVPGVRDSASVEPNVRVDLAFKAGGYIQSLAEVDGRTIRDGDHVTRGMVLARVKTTDYEEKIKQARSQLAEAEAAAVPTKQALDRATALFAAKSLTRPELEQAQAAWATVQAKLSGARALVQEAENAQGDTGLASPIHGVVLKRLIEVGSLVRARSRRLRAGRHLVGQGGVRRARHHAAPVAPGHGGGDHQRSRGGPRVPGTHHQHRAHGRSAKPRVRRRAHDYQSGCRAEGGDGRQRATGGGGRKAGTQTDAVAVPLTAIVRSKAVPNGYAVFVLEEKGGAAVARLRDVTLGDMVGNEVGIVSGLQPGDKIIISGATVVTDGESVRVIVG